MEENMQVKQLMRYRWVIWGILSVSYIIVFFHRIAAAVVADNLMAEFGVTGAVLGNLGAMYFYIYMVMQIPSGILADTLGARKTVTMGCLVAGAGSIVFGIAPGINVGYVGRFLVGLGVSVIFVSILKIQSQWFRESEFATISGITSFIGNGGSLLAGVPLAIAVAMFSWRFVFIVIGIISVILSGMIYLIVRNKPEDIGFPSIAEVEGRAVRAAAGVKPDVIKGLKSVVSNKWTWPGFIAFAGLSGSLLSFTGMWGVPYLMAVYGFDKTRASSYTMTAMAGLMIGSLVAGVVSDRLGRRKLPFLVYGLSYLAIWITFVFWNTAKPPVAVLYPLMFLMGFTAPGFIISWAIGKEVNPPEIAGIAIGTLNIGGFLGPSVLQPLMGYVLDMNWAGQMANGTRIYSQAAYFKALSLCVAAIAIGVAGILLVKETRCKNIYYS
ncbi:MAG: MFS transporter [Bacillota bacterium]|nr:MFS transporter [Bacillota bacterium]